MIGREAIGPAGDAIGLAALGEEFAVERVVLGLDEDRLAPIAALGNVMRDAGNGYARMRVIGRLLQEEGVFYN